MMSVKTMGLVIRTTTVGDYNKMLTVLSPELGRISVWCKGIKSMKNKNAPACDILCYSEFVLTQKGDAYTLSQASLNESFYGLRKSVRKLAYAMYFAELAGIVTDEGMDATGILKLLLNTLYFLEKGKKSAEELRAIYELRLLCCSGFGPSVDSCAICGGNAEFFDIKAGGAVCGDCKREGAKRISEAALSLLRFYVEEGLGTVLKGTVDTAALPEVLDFCESFLKIQLDRKIPTLEYLKNVLSDPAVE